MLPTSSWQLVPSADKRRVRMTMSEFLGATLAIRIPFSLALSLSLWPAFAVVLGEFLYITSAQHPTLWCISRAGSLLQSCFCRAALAQSPRTSHTFVHMYIHIWIYSRDVCVSNTIHCVATLRELWFTGATRSIVHLISLPGAIHLHANLLRSIE